MLTRRTAVAIVFVPIIVWLALRGGVWFAGLVAVIAFLASFELAGLARRVSVGPHRVVVFAGAVAMPVAMYADSRGEANGVVTGGVIAAVAIAALALGLRSPAGGPRPILVSAVTTWVVVYTAWLPGHLVLLRELPRAAGVDYAAGGKWVLSAFLLTWALDTGAYLVGRTVGRHPLAPGVSPGKTIEGALGGVVTSVAMAMGLRGWFGGAMSAVEAAGVGILVAMAGTLGDLAESKIKRDAGVKDASAILPGHGGVLDRFDSLFFIGPVLYYLARFLVR